MIGIKIAGEFLELSAATKITLKLVSPLFSKSLGYNSHSYQFSVPDSGKNQRLLEGAPFVLVKGGAAVYDCVLYVLGIRWQTGKLIKGKAQLGGTYSVSIELDASRLARALQGAKLHDYPYGGREIIGQSIGQARADNMASKMLLTLQTSSFYEFHQLANAQEESQTVFGHKIGRVINRWYNDPNYTGYATNYLNPAWGLPTAEYSICPFFRVDKVLQHVLVDNFGFSFRSADPLLDDFELARLTIYNNFLLDQFSGASNINHWQNVIEPHNHLPDILLSELIKAIDGSFNFVLIEQEGELFFFHREAALDAEPENWSDKGLGYLVDYQEALGWQLSDPLDKDDLYHEPPARRESLSLDSEVITESLLPTLTTAEAGTKYLVQESNAVMQWDGSAWAFYSWYYYGLTIGKGQQELIGGASPLQHYFEPNGDFYTVDINAAVQSDAFAGGGSAAPLRLMLYRGTVDLGAGPYPIATAGDMGGVYQNSLYWHGENGRYKKRFKRWLAVLEGIKRLDSQLDFDATDLMQLDYLRPKRIRVAEGYATALLQEIEIVISQNGIESTTAKMLPI